ncbi:hypothetical protein JDV02_002754 [Purpureocillium takamizusanense]|uniref:L-type lectin-like domain-containing protein n=1 Tax=Purpureocillium takamizusanense TaxID=2060973 RepID=A0A9Q8QA24_9HYPO|nr:uncharacterized protein JDV02_002754 [Purpureocillium takamizusanense]UNI16313.1 hypothetical protein JDV02_002754 [Purpureocillium takamizusanense]
MRAIGLSAALAALLAGNVAQAQWLINELSFGHSGRLDHDGHGKIPGFTISGQPHQPELLSNKIILTPVAPGNQRGAIWADSPLTRSAWTADVDFRANGPERGNGNLNIWLARQGSRDIGSNSIYTVGKFEGLGLVIDTHGGATGMVRGFLNDGSVDYVHQHNVDKLAFGHCYYQYRNLGRPSQIKFRQTHSSFRVDIDGTLCFETDKVSIPPGYHFGLSAATPDTPDSFEVFKMVVMSESTVSGEDHHDKQQKINYESRQTRSPGGAQEDPEAGNIMPDQPAEMYTTSSAQFQDLHNRLQSATHLLNAVHRTNLQHRKKSDDDQEDIKHTLHELREQLLHSNRNDDLNHRIRELESEVRSLRDEIHNKLSAHQDDLHRYLGQHHTLLSHTVTSSMPGHGKLIFIIVGTQALLVTAYVLYKKRKANSPKKYL